MNRCLLATLILCLSFGLISKAQSSDVAYSAYMEEDYELSEELFQSLALGTDSIAE
jgi:hypothetical protein